METMLAILEQDHSWSRRCSTETVFSIQGRETDFARDTSDTEAVSDGHASDTDPNVEYEPVTEDDDEDDAPVEDDASAQSDNDIIATKVIEVSVGDDGDLVFADSEQTDSYESDSEMDLYDYWLCAQCQAANNNPLYRYCQKCFQVRKNFFPPRPRPKRKKTIEIPLKAPRTLSQDSGVDVQHPCSQDTYQGVALGEGTSKPETAESSTIGRYTKRRAETDRPTKRKRVSRTDSESDSDENVKPLVKTISDPSITIDEVDPLNISKKAIAHSLRDLESKDMCVVCCSEPKSGVFVHGRIAHICCCYKCAVKVWTKNKRCPVCNCKVSNVLKAVVM